uniref:Uncharacterized protein n=1 Tax=Lygus hesperus TaxID=30085 RepID=A0A0A9Y7W4_LYGHE
MGRNVACQRAIILFTELKSFFAFTNSSPHLKFGVALPSKSEFIECIAPSMPALMPPRSCFSPQLSVTSSTVASTIHLPGILRKHSPIPMGRTPGHLSIATNLLAIKALTDSQGTSSLHSLLARVATASRSRELDLP